MLWTYFDEFFGGVGCMTSITLDLMLVVIVTTMRIQEIVGSFFDIYISQGIDAFAVWWTL